MTQFLKYMLFVSVFSLLGLKLLDIAYTKVYAKGSLSKFQYFRTYKNQKVDYVLLGSSRVENILNPKIIDSITGKKTINLGVQGGRLKDIFLFLKAMDDYNIKNEKIFIQLDYIYNMPNAHSNFLSHQVLPFVNESKAVKEYVNEFENSFVLNYFPFLRYAEFDQKLGIRELSVNGFKKTSMFSEYNGYTPVFGNNLKSSYSLPSKILEDNKVFEEILDYIDNNNLDVVFFCNPMRSDTHNLNYIELLKDRVPSFKDYSRRIKDNKLFKDNLHLNKKGSEFFSVIFANDI